MVQAVLSVLERSGASISVVVGRSGARGASYFALPAAVPR